MGNRHSRQRYAPVAIQAFEAAERLYARYGGRHPPSGAILEYIDGRISSQQLIQRCTSLEANEYLRLAVEPYARFVAEHGHEHRCRPGSCQYPNDASHFPGCRYVEPDLPPEIRVDEAEGEQLVEHYIAEIYGGGEHGAGRSSELSGHGRRSAPHGGGRSHGAHHGDHRNQRYDDMSDPSDGDDSDFYNGRDAIKGGGRRHGGGGGGGGGNRRFR